MSVGSINKVSTSGFTIVEITTVIVIVGILAALSYFGYTNWRQNTMKSAVQSDLNTLRSAMDNAKNWNNGYPVYAPNTVMNSANVTTSNVFKSSKEVIITYRSGTAANYCADGQNSTNLAIQYYYDTTGGNTEVKTGSCTP